MKKTCWKLFSSMLLLSGLTFGGGFVIIPLMQRRFVQELGWLTEEEILDMTAFARASPGAVTVNVAVQVGARVAGAAGAACGVLGTIVPPLAVLSAISLCYGAFSASPIVAALLYGLRLAVMGGVCLLAMTADISTIWLLAGGAVLGWFLAGREAV